MRRRLLSLSAIILLALQCVAAIGLEDGFRTPPDDAKARVWWHWLNGNVTREGITADLEAMKEAGIKDAQIFSVDMAYPEGPAVYLGEEWLELVRFAASEASRLGLELGFHNSAGWANSGGPWISPEYSMQKVVLTETVCTGGAPGDVNLPQPRAVRGFYRDIAVIAFPKPGGRQRIVNLDYKNLSGRTRNHLLPDTSAVSDAAVVNGADVVDVTRFMKPSGRLDWDIPEGEWVVLRIGHTSTGTENHPAVAGGRGLECDKMSKAAADLHWKHGIEPLLDRLGDFVGSTVVDCVIDSYEVGSCNWTEGFDSHFEELRGYSLMPFMPTFAGYYVDGTEQTERFLWDFRRTVGDLMAENYYGRFRTLCNERGLKLYVEPYWGPFDSMQVGDRADMVMCEFWSGVLGAFDSAKFVSSIAHLNGNTLAGAEAFTSYGAWLDYPASIKAVGDKAWAEGINRFTFHSYTHQPWNKAPGLTFGHYGMDFNRLNTWWNQGKAYLDYVARSQFMLQQGHCVADVLVYVGESSPNNASYMPSIKRLGYDYDFIGTDKLMTLTCQNGRMRAEAGGDYRVLYIQNFDRMTPRVMAKLAELAAGGAVIVGRRPAKSPSLSEYPECDAEVSRLANRLWGLGRIKDVPLEKALADFLPIPDFRVDGDSGNDVVFLHRSMGEADIYFVADGASRGHTRVCTFRNAGRVPEFWNAVTGEIAEAAVWQVNEDGTITLPIDFEPEGAVFVVFRKPQSKSRHVVGADISLSRAERPLPSDLEILEAEYGYFLPAGLADVKARIEEHFENGRLRFHAGNHLCADPAPGFIKELRMVYELDGKRHELTASEHELVDLNRGGEAELKVIGAVYGKYDIGIQGVPEAYAVSDVKDSLINLLSDGRECLTVGEGNPGFPPTEGPDKRLRISYRTGGKVWQTEVPDGEILRFGPAGAESKLLSRDGGVYWHTPAPGAMMYRTSDGRSKKVSVKSVPSELGLTGPWSVRSAAFDTVFSKLISWPQSSDDRVKYFSGTATYTTEFNLDRRPLSPDVSLELDLGDVNVFADVRINGKSIATLWKAPYRVNIDGYVEEGINRLEVDVTNLWPNRLIGDDSLPEDYEMNGNRISKWPDWLGSDVARESGRTTFTTWKHWSKTDELLPSGLCGPVVIRSYAKVKLK